MKIFKSLTTLAAVTFLAACGSTTQNNAKSSATTPTVWENVQKAGTLKVATPGTLFPTAYKNDKGELIGYEIDMMNEIGKRLNLKIDYTEIGVAEALTALDSGKVDVAVNNFTPSKERLEKYNFSEYYKYSIGGMIVRADGSSNITAADLSDWKGKKAGGGAGTHWMKITQKLGGIPTLYDNVTNDVYLRDVSVGRTDFIPNDYFTQVMAVKIITKKFPDIKVKMGNVKYNPTESGIVMKKTDNSLKDKLDEVIKAMKADGTLKAISEKYYAGQDLSKPLDNVSQYPVVDFSDIP